MRSYTFATNDRASQRRAEMRLAHEANLEKSLPGLRAAISGETQAIADTLAGMAERLVELEEEIRSAQPRAHKAVLLGLRHCGTGGKPGCSGCPHPRWYRWVNTGQEHEHKPHRWFAAAIDSPLRYIRGKQIPEGARELIREAVALIQYRRKLLAALVSLKRSHAAYLRHMTSDGSTPLS